MTPKKTRQDHHTSFASSPLITAAHACPAQHPFSLLPASTSEDTPPFAAPSLPLPLSPIRPVIRYDVRRSRMARSARSPSLSLCLFRKPCLSLLPSRREGGRPHPPKIPPRLRVPHLPFSPLCPRVKHFSQRERLSSRQVSLSHSGLAFRSLALCPRSEDAIHVYTKCAPRAMGGGKDGRADDGRRDDGTDVEEGEER